MALKVPDGLSGPLDIMAGTAKSIAARTQRRGKTGQQNQYAELIHLFAPFKKT